MSVNTCAVTYRNDDRRISKQKYELNEHLHTFSVHGWYARTDKILTRLFTQITFLRVTA